MEEFRGAGIAPGLLVRPLLPLQGFLDADLECFGRLGQLEQLTRGELVLAQFPQRLHRLYSHSEDLPLLGEVEVARVV